MVYDKGKGLDLGAEPPVLNFVKYHPPPPGEIGAWNLAYWCESESTMASATMMLYSWMIVYITGC